MGFLYCVKRFYERNVNMLTICNCHCWAVGLITNAHKTANFLGCFTFFPLRNTGKKNINTVIKPILVINTCRLFGKLLFSLFQYNSYYIRMYIYIYLLWRTSYNNNFYEQYNYLKSPKDETFVILKMLEYLWLNDYEKMNTKQLII